MSDYIAEIRIRDVLNRAPESRLNLTQVENFVNAIRQKAYFDPILVKQIQKGKFWLKDGSHRTEACERLGMSRIKAQIT